MRRLIFCLLLLLGSTAAAQDALPTIGSGGSGSFPVFGPSAEREAFFAEQEAKRQETLETLRRERAEAEAARAAAAAAAEAAEARQDEPRRVIASDAIWRQGLGWVIPVEICERLPGILPENTRVPTPDYPRPETPATIVRPAPVPDRIVCRTEYRPVWRPDPRPRTRIDVEIGPDGVTGSLEYRAP